MTATEQDVAFLIVLTVVALFLSCAALPLTVLVEGWVRRMVGRRG